MNAICWGCGDGHTPGSGGYAMSNRAIPCRLQVRGGSLFLLMARELRRMLTWREGDFVGARVCGDKVILERIPLDKLATLRTGDAQPYTPELFNGDGG